jgi:hypothetical protein
MLCRPKAGKQTAGKQTAGKQTAGKQTAGKQTAGKQTAGKQTAGKQTAGKQTAGQAGSWRLKQASCRAARKPHARQANCRAYRHTDNKHGSGSWAHALVLCKVQHPTQDAEECPADLEGRDNDEGWEHPQTLHDSAEHNMEQAGDTSLILKEAERTHRYSTCACCCLQGV